MQAPCTPRLPCTFHFARLSSQGPPALLKAVDRCLQPPSAQCGGPNRTMEEGPSRQSLLAAAGPQLADIVGLCLDASRQAIGRLQVRPGRRGEAKVGFLAGSRPGCLCRHHQLPSRLSMLNWVPAGPLGSGGARSRPAGRPASRPGSRTAVGRGVASLWSQVGPHSGSIGCRAAPPPLPPALPPPRPASQLHNAAAL